MLKSKSLSLVLLAGFALSIAPAWAEDAQSTAKSSGVGKKGIYGKNSIDEEAEHGSKTPIGSSSSSEEKKPLTEAEKRLKEKYPLSTTGKTTSNQRANILIQQGILFYNQTKALFEAANQIENSTEQGTLAIAQKGIIQSRLLPSDLLLYGPENAYISLRIRALQEADRAISKSIASFSQAKGLAPSLSILNKWLRIGRDTQKVVRYHIRFYQLSLKAVNLGYTQKELDYMAKRWSAPKNLKPDDILTTYVDTGFFEALRARANKGDPAAKPMKIESSDQLPNLDFKINNQ